MNDIPQFKVTLDHEGINKYVSDAIIKSALGQKLEEAINRALEPSSYGGKGPIDDVIKTELHNHVRELLRSDAWRPKVEAVVQEELNKVITEEFIQRAVSAVFDKAYE